MSRYKPVAGRVVAVTGGGRGIGREIARQLVLAGASVAVGDRDGSAARHTARELGPRVLGLDLDVADTESFAAFLTAVADQLGPVEVLVNNAGVMWVGPFGAEPEAATRQQVEVNLLGVIRGVQLAAPAMAARGCGHIVTVASAASLLTTPGEATYAATKHGVHGYLKAVREELRHTGVEISVIMPAVVDTELATGTSTGAARLLQPSDVGRVVVATIQRPRFEVSIPRYLDPVNRLVNLLPTPVRDTLLRQLVPNQVEQADRLARAAYEAQFGPPELTRGRYRPRAK